MEPATVLLSGGLDSTVLLYWVVKERQHAPVYAVSCRYGQRHERELEMARWQAAQLPQVCEHTILDLSFFGPVIGLASALCAGGPPVPDLAQLKPDALQQPPTYVPNRNLVLLSIAAAFAEARGCRVVYYGAQAQDRYGYWDCTPEFVMRLNAVLALNRGQAVSVEAPFAGAPKSDGVRLGVRLGVDFSRTWSCYRGEDTPCGTCPTCVERQDAFACADVRDPLT